MLRSRGLHVAVATAALFAGVAPAFGAALGGVPDAASGGALPAGVERPASDYSSDYSPGELLVRFRPEAGAAARAAATREVKAARATRRLPVSGLRLVKLRPGASVRAAERAFERDPDVLYAQPNYRYRLAAPASDPRFGALWSLNNSGQDVLGVKGTADADVDAPEAWNVTTGGDVTVAIVDSGVAYDHPDLRPNIWRNQGESGAGRESNGRDDDGNGFVDDSRGWDFVSNDNDPRDFNGHGTHVAGTVGARGGNGVAGTGVAWKVKLMPLRVANGSGVLNDDWVIEAIDYAASKGVRVMNASFTSSELSPALLDAIRRNNELLVITAAGNGGDDGQPDDNDRAARYPCNFDLPNLICVAASDQHDGLASFSNYGARSVDLAAPGSSVLSTIPAYGPPVLGEGFEGDIAGTWLTGGANSLWGRTNAVARSGSWSLSDSPGLAYRDATDSFARTAAPFSLAGHSGCRLSFAVRLSTEAGPDRLLAEVSRDGSAWSVVDTLSGSTGEQFEDLTTDLSSLDGEGAVSLRYRLMTNQSITSDGVQIDDVVVRCLSASFTGDELGFEDGTSMAVPHVAGAAALVWARYPTLGPMGVRRALIRGVDRKGSLAGKVASGGRLNLRRALDEVRGLLPNLGLAGAGAQRALKRRSVVVYARCSQACAVVATGRLTVAGTSRSLGLKKVARSVGARRRGRLVLRFSRRAAASAAKALRRHHRVIARVRVTASNRYGNAARARRAIRLRR